MSPLFYYAAALRRRRRQAGYVLITTLMVLVMLTLLALAMYRGFGVQEKMAGATRDKERAFQVAQNTLAYGEWLLLNGTPATGVACSGSSVVSSLATMRVCNTALSNPIDPDNWSAAQTYTPPSITVAAGGGTYSTSTGLEINYAKTPKLYMSYLGLSPDGKQYLYAVTAAAYGGAGSTVAVVKSVYSRAASTENLDGL
jgi:type IV pilus assembly protein PilX